MSYLQNTPLVFLTEGFLKNDMMPILCAVPLSSKILELHQESSYPINQFGSTKLAFKEAEFYYFENTSFQIESLINKVVPKSSLETLGRRIASIKTQIILHHKYFLFTTIDSKRDPQLFSDDEIFSGGIMIDKFQEALNSQ